ncbi:MAG: maleylpyruvate isomerase N-terminal domain-containing protein [Chloroflexi bacterium]|nr:maleylpyruvate isomerase N-terminal domain-containing protein [Chloroflexota bacterium]
MDKAGRPLARRSYGEALRALEDELAATQALLATLPDEAWRRPTRLPGWDVLTLLAHLVGAVQSLAHATEQPASGPPDFARTTYYRYDPAVTAPQVDARARVAAQGQSPDSLRGALTGATTAGLRAAAATDPATVVPSRRGTIRIEDFLPTRVVEACIHGLDLRSAIGAPPTPTPLALRVSADFLDDMLGGPRPPELVGDDVAFVEVATGRRRHPDPRFPLLQ